MAGNTLLPNVAWVVFRVDQDLVQQRPSPAHSRERHPPPAMLADAVTFFVSSATMYAAPTPAPSRSGVAGSLAALSRDLEELVSPQYQAKNRDIGLTAPIWRQCFGAGRATRAVHPGSPNQSSLPTRGGSAGGRSPSSQGFVTQDRTAGVVSGRKFAVPIVACGNRRRCSTYSAPDDFDCFSSGLSGFRHPNPHPATNPPADRSAEVAIKRDAREYERCGAPSSGHRQEEAARCGPRATARLPHGDGVVTALLLYRARTPFRLRASVGATPTALRGAAGTPSHASRLPVITEELST
jgi:hypothetical protein